VLGVRVRSRPLRPGAHTGPRQRTRERVHILVKSSQVSMVVCCLCIDLTCTYSPTPQQKLCVESLTVPQLYSRFATGSRLPQLDVRGSDACAATGELGWMFRPAFATNNWSVHQLNGRPVPGAPVTA